MQHALSALRHQASAQWRSELARWLLGHLADRFRRRPRCRLATEKGHIMTQTSRRDLLRAGLAGAAICAAPTLLARRGTADTVLVVGSGPAGATAALALAERGGASSGPSRTRPGAVQPIPGRTVAFRQARFPVRQARTSAGRCESDPGRGNRGRLETGAA